MATSAEYIEFVCEQIKDCGEVRHKKMFGEYMVYVDNKAVLLVCDNTVYVKKLPVIEILMSDADVGNPYDGAKEHYILDVENIELSSEVIRLVSEVTPVKEARKRKA